MNDIIRKDITEIIKKAIIYAKEGEAAKLNVLSNHSIHNASIFQDEYSTSIAVIIYSISKIIENCHNHNAQFTVILEKAKECIETGDIDGYGRITKELLSLISEIDNRFTHFVDDVVRQAQVKKGTKIYDHGISLGQAAKILGISQWELMEYAGKNKVDDHFYDRPDVIEKIKFARSLFQ